MRAVISYLLFAAFAALCANSARGEQLTLSLNSSDSIHVHPGEESDSLRLLVSRSGTVADVDFLTGWQASLVLVPKDGTLGTLSFDNASEPEVGYVFAGIGSLGVSTVVSGSELFAFDSHFPFSGGAELESGTSANLLEITLLASADALGRFGLFAVPGLGSSEWSDASQPLFLRREFSNVRDDDSPIRLADVTVAQPGDFNFDGDVDGDDFLQWQRGDSFAPFSADDLQDWNQNVGFNANPVSAISSIEAIPEPSSMVILVLALCLLGILSR